MPDLISLFRAEWRKVVGNRLASMFLVLIFPAGMAGSIVLLLIGALLSADFRHSALIQHLYWTDAALSVWALVNSEVGRIIELAFAAIVFAGEYQWGTWKNLIPRSQRVALILIKFVTLVVFMMLAFIATSIIAVIGEGLLAAVSGVSYGMRDASQSLLEFAGIYVLDATVALASILIACSYTALAAMITRSILGSVLFGLLVTFAETVSLLALTLLNALFHLPDIIKLYFLTPEYNLGNIKDWAERGIGPTLRVADLAFDPQPVGFSIGIILIWVITLVGVTVYLFRRQDITT